ncbi:SpoIIE family protein phosphatase, partial [Streptomyces sp. NPDC005146]
MRGTNRLLIDLDPGQFASCCYVLLDPETGEARAVRAGHPQPLLLRPDGTAEQVDLAGGSALTDITYVFDEPSTGLHPADVRRLNQLLLRLRDAGNTVLVVEHHPQVIRVADHVIDMGPGAGADGGLVRFEGTPEELRGSDTLTGRLLSTPLELRREVREPRGHVRVARASAHNLTGFDVDVPLGALTAVTGVAGSGKSSFAVDELPRQHREFTVVGQDPLRGGVRSMSLSVLVGEREQGHELRAGGLHRRD